MNVTDSKRLTPPQIAAILGCKVQKVRFWIETGELKAVNYATNRNGIKPRWKVRPEDFEAFERSREVQPVNKPGPRKGSKRRLITQPAKEYV